MPDSSPPRMLSAPLRLTAMTLRGLGPYLHGARLEIKPLTILCGENGSGKSTWIEALRFLKLATDNEKDDSFPLKVPHNAARVSLNEPLLQPGVQKLSDLRLARLRLLGELNEVGEEVKSLRKANRKKFGPPGCIGLIIKAVAAKRIKNFKSDDIELPGDLTNRPERLLWLGEVSSSATIRVRWTLPVSRIHDALHQCIELTLNRKHVIRLRRSLDETDEPYVRRKGQSPFVPRWKEEHFTFECTSEFLGRLPRKGNKPIKLGLVDKDGNVVDVASESPITDRETAQRACTNFLTLFRLIIGKVTEGLFPIGPVRRILSNTATTATPTDPRMDREGFEDLEQEWRKKEESERRKADETIRCKRRYVGHNGRNTQELHGYWAYNLMRQPTAPYCGAIPNEFSEPQFNRELVTPASLLSRLSEDLQNHEDFQTHILSLAEPELRDAWMREHDAAERDRIAINVLNQALRSRDLFRREFRPAVTGEARDMIGSTDEEQAERLSSRNILNDDEVKRVNRLLLEAVFDKSADAQVQEIVSQGYRVEVDDYPARNCWHRSGFLFETFVSFWMNRLCQTRVKYLKFEGDPLDKSWTPSAEGQNESVPIGALISRKRNWQKRGDFADQTEGRKATEEDLVETITPPTTRYSADWSIMSTGFHQLAPIVVQAGLLRQNEIMAVENPEAHLHPSLQIKVAEFLMHQANAGKIMLIETHSDLFVRRVLRAIREEQVSLGNVFKQSSVGINFTSLVDDPQGFSRAEIEQLEVNEKGQVHNWPAGFMDDDLKEADRWLQANFRSGIFDEDSDE